MKKTLIIYYSRKGENYCNGSIENLKKGNTEIAAEDIAKAVNGTLFEVKPIKKYANDYKTCTVEAKKELQNNERPGLCEYLNSLDGYDNVVVAGPCWWGTYPCPVFTQLERLDFTGKTVFPVMTHEGSGLGSSARDLKKICTGAVIKEGLAVHGSDVRDAGDFIQKWAETHLL